MPKNPISTRPVSKNEELLRTKFYENIAAQSDLMDKLSERLLTLALAVPGLYATALKLLYGDSVTVTLGTLGYLAFGLWFASLVLTLIALTPKKWTINPQVLRQDPQKESEGLGIEDFFERSAERKLKLVTASSVAFFLGIVSAVLTL